MIRFPGFSKRWLLAWTLSCQIISGCALVPLKPLENEISPVQAIDKNSGVIVLKVQTGQGSTVPRWMNLDLIDESNPGINTVQTKKLINIQPGYAEYSLFVGVLPAGKWRPGLLKATRFTDGNGSSIDYRYSIGGAGSFLVNAGEISDLGTVAILPSGKSIEFGNRSERNISQQMASILIPNSKDESRQLLSVVMSKMPAELRIAESVAWDSKPEQALLKAAAFRQGESYRFMSPVIEPDAAYFGEEFGQIRVRHSGKWEWLDTGLASNVTALARMKNGNLLAGGSHGVVVTKRSSTTTWSSMPLPVRDGVVIALHEIEPYGIFAVIRIGAEAVVFSTPKEGGVWTELKRFSASGNSLFPESVKIMTAVTEKKLAVHIAEIAFLMESNIHVFDLKTGIWQTNSTTMWLPSFVADGSTFSLRGTGFSPYAAFSPDYGKTWEERSGVGLGFVAFFKMKTPMVGYYIRIKDGIFLFKTSDGAKTWQETSKLPEQFAHIFSLGDGEMLGVGMSGNIHVSKDAGVSWSKDNTF